MSSKFWGQTIFNLEVQRIINLVKIFSDMQELENSMPQEQTFTEEANARCDLTKQGVIHAPPPPAKKKGGQGV